MSFDSQRPDYSLIANWWDYDKTAVLEQKSLLFLQCLFHMITYVCPQEYQVVFCLSQTESSITWTLIMATFQNVTPLYINVYLIDIIKHVYFITYIHTYVQTYFFFFVFIFFSGILLESTIFELVCVTSSLKFT